MLSSKDSFDTMPGMRKTKEQAQKTKETILMAALDCFSKKGYFNTSLDDIARSASVTRGAVYWHFKNKPEIFDALHDSLHQPFIQMITQDLEKSDDHPLKQLEHLVIFMLKNLESNQTKKRTLRLFYQCDYSGDLLQFKQKHQDKKISSLELLSYYFERAQKKGQLTEEANPDILTLTLHCFLRGILYEYLIGSDLISMENHAHLLVTQLFKGLNTSQSLTNKK
ncbi:MAG: TetR family transcriptional regulator [Xanthomonadales bacterium]|nr:TetR family transcriptional regulator [Xanthomonadales bacterium]